MVDRLWGSLQEKEWPKQAQRLLDLGFHNELGISEAEYKAGLPLFQTLPIYFTART